ncbi:MAG TPA: amidase family protein [Nevskiaceae bacterium]|nr:amidase family protein [Nevskiaceae bacterium]
MRHSVLAAASITLAACGSSTSLNELSASRADGGAAQCLQVVDGIDLEAVSVPELRAALNAGLITSEALTQAYLDRIATFDLAGPALDAVRALAPDALGQARKADADRASGIVHGPLDGLTILLKDNIGTRDMPTTAGSIALALNFPKHEATITTKLRSAGAIVLGKANLSEFANWVSETMPSGYSSLGGQVINPYDFTQSPLGSSSGSAVGGTMAFSTLTIGTETSGSIISPSTVNSMVGLKPTLGLVSRYGIIPLAPSFDTAGPIVRDVTDAAILLGVIAGVDPNDPATDAFTRSPLAGVVPDYAAHLSPTALMGARLGVRSDDLGSSDLFDNAVATLQQQGATIVSIPDPVSSTVASSSDGSIAELGAIFNEFKVSLNRYLAQEAGPDVPVHTLGDIIHYNNQHRDKIPYGQNLLVASNAQSGFDSDPVELASRNVAIHYAQLWINTMVDAFALDAIIAPDFNNVSATAAAGYPDITVPMGYDGQNPHGLSFAGKAWTEQRLLQLAYAYEQASKLRQPPAAINPQLAAFCGS